MLVRSRPTGLLRRRRSTLAPRMKICMFVKNSFEYDARVTKEAKSLIGAGHASDPRPVGPVAGDPVFGEGTVEPDALAALGYDAAQLLLTRRRERLQWWGSDLGGKRTSTSVSRPNSCACASSNPAAARLPRISSRLAGCV